MSYATPDDVIARYPNRDLIQLSNTDPAATTINTAALQQALDDASAEIDGYLESRFQLPLNNPPAVLNRVVCDVAMYRLQTLRPLHDVADARKRYEDAIAMLLEVAKGVVTLGLSADAKEPPASQNEAIVVQDTDPAQAPVRIFSRNKLKGF